MTVITPDTVREIAHRISAGIVSSDDAVALEWVAMQWRRCERALDEIAADAMEQAQIAEESAGVVVQFPGPQRVRGSLS